MRHTLRLGETEVQLADADLAQLHDTLLRLHSFPNSAVRDLCNEIRRRLGPARAEEPLDLAIAGARLVQLAVYADKMAGRRVSAALTAARLKAFRYLEAPASKRQHQ